MRFAEIFKTELFSKFKQKAGCYISKIYDIMIERQGEKVVITYRGSGFMYHMVRILTGTLLEVGSGMRSIESVGAALESKVRADAGFLAQASGLTLREVYYH